MLPALQSHPLQWTSERVKSRQSRPNSEKKLSEAGTGMGKHRGRFLGDRHPLERREGT